MAGGVAYTPANGTTDTGVALDTYKRLFTEARDLSQTVRETAKAHRRYYDGKIDDKLKRILRRKRQPDFTINRVRPGIEGMVGVVEGGKAEPRALPRNGPDQQSAETATKCLGYVSDTNRWPRSKLKVFRNMLVEGTAAVLIEVDDQLEVRFRRIRYEEFFHDPYSREDDFSDASYMGLAKWQYVDEIEGAYPEHAGKVAALCSAGDYGDATWADRPDDHSTMWTDPRRKRMLVVEMYKRERGEWLKCVFVGSLKLEEGPSPYLDSKGKPCNPIEAQSAYVDDDNQRHGAVADMVGPQDEINVYRRKAAHRATFRQFQESDPVAAYADPEEVRREGAKPDGVIPPGYQVVPDDKFNMDMALLAEAKAEIERTGPNPAILGRGNSSSGRQDLVRQQAGLTELAHLFAGLDDLEHRVMAQAWARIRQFWTAPKMIRVTDAEGEIQFMQVNEPIFGEPQPVMDPVTGLPKYDPMTRQIVMERPLIGMKRQLATVDVDIKIDTTPDTASVQQEQYNGLIELAKVGALGKNPGKILLKASSLPMKRELLEELKAEEEQAAGGDPMQAEAARLAMAKAGADIEKTNAQTAQAQANALKTMSDARVNEMQARTAVLPIPPGF